MKILADGRWIPADITGIQMNLEEDSFSVGVEMDLTFLDEADADAASRAVGAGPWRVLFDRAEMVDGEKMLRDAMGRGRPVTLEEAVANKMMGGPDEGCIAIRSITVEAPLRLFPTARGMMRTMLRAECRARAVGWFHGKPNELDEVLRGIEEA